jgi:molybdopterin converting factor small subunit
VYERERGRGRSFSPTKLNRVYHLPMIEVRLFGGIKRHAEGKNRIELKSEAVKSVDDILLSIEIPKGEIGQVLVNGAPVEPSRNFKETVVRGDIVDIYPIAAGG